MIFFRIGSLTLLTFLVVLYAEMTPHDFVTWLTSIGLLAGLTFFAWAIAIIDTAHQQPKPTDYDGFSG